MTILLFIRDRGLDLLERVMKGPARPADQDLRYDIEELLAPLRVDAKVVDRLAMAEDLLQQCLNLDVGNEAFRVRLSAFLREKP